MAPARRRSTGRRIATWTLALLIGITLPLAAQAITISLFADLSGDQETPPLGVPGIGSAAMLYDTDTNLLSWSVLYAGLTGDLLAAHFHAAPVGVAGGIKIDIGAGLPLPPMGMLTGSATVDQADEADLLDQGWYLNLHTMDNPGGEIRGQVLNATAHIPPVPEPALGTLLLIGCVAAAVRRRRD